MRERQISSFFELEPKVPKKVLTQIAEQVSTGLGFGEFSVIGGLKRVVVRDIAQALYLNSIILLNIPVPLVFLGTDFAVSKKGEEVSYYAGFSYSGGYLPVIYYSSLYMEALTTPLRNKTDQQVDLASASVIETTAHECYHFWQAVNFPNTYAANDDAHEFEFTQQSSRWESSADHYARTYELARKYYDPKVTKISRRFGFSPSLFLTHPVAREEERASNFREIQ